MGAKGLGFVFPRPRLHGGGHGIQQEDGPRRGRLNRAPLGCGQHRPL